ncbi:DUF6766 family protein [Dongia soli]|uniref:DUF6766 family protein n=1 Tax=Dongia soli TaxID=600628 RepID=A0ABU5EGH9_9PROT|nr:DUF6766 family protein [Dongia soli]MDY0884600.1 DUF6766 family protein [Dongia soli]
MFFWAGQAVAGWLSYNEMRIEHQLAPLNLTRYLSSSHFIEATSENWESEFLQMGLFVLLTVFLRQKGSAESNPMPEEEGEEDSGSAEHSIKSEPSAARQRPRRGLGRWLYEHSLSLAFFLLFFLAFVAHAISGASLENSERMAHNEPPQELLGFLASSQFWFESFQNWQSEFLAVGAIVLLSIWLRERGSSQSKPVDAPNEKTGG